MDVSRCATFRLSKSRAAASKTAYAKIAYGCESGVVKYSNIQRSRLRSTAVGLFAGANDCASILPYCNSVQSRPAIVTFQSVGPR
jgi:hypothetical protein